MNMNPQCVREEKRGGKSKPNTKFRKIKVDSTQDKDEEDSKCFPRKFMAVRETYNPTAISAGSSFSPQLQPASLSHSTQSSTSPKDVSSSSQVNTADECSMVSEKNSGDQILHAAMLALADSDSGVGIGNKSIENIEHPREQDYKIALSSSINYEPEMTLKDYEQLSKLVHLYNQVEYPNPRELEEIGKKIKTNLNTKSYNFFNLNLIDFRFEY